MSGTITQEEYDVDDGFVCERCKEKMKRFAITRVTGKTIHNWYCPKCNKELDVTHPDIILEWKN